MESAVESRTWDVWVEKDGTFTEEVEDEIVILKDSARLTRGMVRINYNPAVSKLEVIAAETIKGESRIPVSQQLIEDKPLASVGEGFDQWHQVMIAFPGVDVGSRVHLKYRKKWSHVPTPGFYSEMYYYGAEYQKTGRLVLRSKLPLITKINDPENQFKVSRADHENGEYPYRLELRLKEPVLKNVVDEQDPFFDLSIFPSITIASSRDWSDLSKSVVAQYEAISSSKLPPLFQTIADKARAVQDPVERINLVTSQLADKVRYLGDWRTLKGQWIPRPLQTIASSQFGDCKDFSVTVAAILKNLGMDAKVAWVWRGWNPVVESYELPSTFRFNHAITQVKSGDHVYWIDGTNVASFAQGVPGDISNRPALVLDSKNAALTRLPAPAPESFSYAFGQQMDFSNPDGIRVQGTFRTTGGDAAGWIAGNLNTSQDTLDFKVVRAAARTDSFRDWKVEDFKINSRVVSELKAKYRYVESAQGYRSTAGLAYPIVPPDAVDRLLFNIDQRVSDIVIGELFTYARDMVLGQVSVVGQESLACSFDSPWVSFSREVARVPSGLQVRDRLQLKKQLIRHAEYTTPAFSELQKKLVSCFKFSSVIYQSDKAQSHKASIN